MPIEKPAIFQAREMEKEKLGNQSCQREGKTLKKARKREGLILCLTQDKFLADSWTIYEGKTYSSLQVRLKLLNRIEIESNALLQVW